MKKQTTQLKKHRVRGVGLQLQHKRGCERLQALFDPVRYHDTAGPIHVEDGPSLTRKGQLTDVWVAYLRSDGYLNPSQDRAS
jgi:hypothetical protein